MTCHLCGSVENSFSYTICEGGVLELCGNCRLLVFRALLYDFNRAGLVEEIMKDVVEKGPKSL